MNITLQGWLHAVGATLNAPADMAERVLSERFARPTLVQGVIVVAIINLMLLAIVSMLSPPPIEDAVYVTPITLTILIAGSMFAMAFAIARAGRMLGGAGDFDGALTAVIWLQAVGLTIDVAQIFLMLISPTLAVLLGIGALVALFWCTVNFVNVLHGFASLGKATITLIIAMIGTIIAVVVMMALLGITPSGDMT
ncbi:YIP1 family protein [Yoonia sp. I 8.24]|uniref:YIP1 family protein n=1 Tax=Yoonia sp. I 8.24 TaxID=1537229 RepID=UPI001EDEB53A|nr:YIP1 family protein [Yoonia sp. I 8.24]MCG3266283.1 YIP1 family protein [Yoonia sp. I 8.24]